MENKLITAIAKKFNLNKSDFTIVKTEGITAVVQNTPEGLEGKGSWNDVMSAPSSDWKVKVDGQSYDCRKGMTWAVYKALQDSLKEKVDTQTYTWLTGEADKLPDWIKHLYGEPRVPGGDWYDSQVESRLHWASNADDNIRPRLAVIVSQPSALSPSPESSPLNLDFTEIHINGNLYRKVDDEQ